MATRDESTAHSSTALTRFCASLTGLKLVNGLLSLNGDIFLLIFDSLDENRSLWSLMRSCRKLYHEGIPAFLSRRVKLASPLHYASFCTFIRHQPASRPKYLREIHIHRPRENVSEKDLTDLLLILEQAKGLRKIAITHFAPNKFANLDAILRALENHTELQELEITLPGNDLVGKLARWKSSLCQISIHSSYPNDSYDPNFPPVNLTRSLMPFQLSLRKVSAFNCDITWEAVEFPLVEELWLSVPWAAHMEAVIRSFPNVQVLGFRRTGPLGGPIPPKMPRKSQWKSLAWLSGDLASIAICQLHTKVQHLDLHVRERIYRPHAMDEILSKLQAQQVTVTMREVCWRSDLPHFLAFLRSLLRTVSKRLYRLNIVLEISQKDMDMNSIMNTIIEELPGLPSLAKFSVFASWVYVERLHVVHVSDSETGQNPSSRLTEISYAILPTVDVEDATARIAELIPSLSLRQFSLSGPEGQFEWQVNVAANDGTKTLRLVTSRRNESYASPRSWT